MALLVLICLATVSYTAFQIFLSRAGTHIDPLLSAVIVNGLGCLLPLVMYLVLQSSKQRDISISSRGLSFSLLAGASIAIFQVLLILSFERGKISLVVPMVYGGTIALVALFGWFLFNEPRPIAQILGVIAILGGISLIALNNPS